jgi:hypothetical protein
MDISDAVKLVLEDHSYLPMNIEDITASINQRNLCTAQNGAKPDIRQIGLEVIGNVVKSTSPDFEVLIKLK